MSWIKKLFAKFKKSAIIKAQAQTCPFNEDGHFEGDMVSKVKKCSHCKAE